MQFTIRPPDLSKALAKTEKDIEPAATSGMRDAADGLERNSRDGRCHRTVEVRPRATAIFLNGNSGKGRDRTRDPGRFLFGSLGKGLRVRSGISRYRHCGAQHGRQPAGSGEKLFGSLRHL